MKTHSYPCLYADNARKILLDAAGAIVPDSDREVLNSLTKFVDQLPSVFDQVILQFSENFIADLLISPFSVVRLQVRLD